MDILAELNRLTKVELIELISNGFLFKVTKRDIIRAKIGVLARRADMESKKALISMGKYSGVNSGKWLKATKDHDKAMKIYAQIDLLYKGLLINK